RRHTRSKRDWSSDVCSSDLVMALLKSRAETLNELADNALMFCQAERPPIDPALKEQVLTPEARAILQHFTQQAQQLDDWSVENLSALIKAFLQAQELRMPQLGIPLRVAVAGVRQTPAIDAVLAIFGKDKRSE